MARVNESEQEIRKAFTHPEPGGGKPMRRIFYLDEDSNRGGPKGVP